jgi:RNA polymerase-binding transcription factor DksA
MKAILFIVGPLALYSFGLLLAIGTIFSLFQVWRLARQQALEEEKVIDTFIVSVLLGLFGGRLGYAFLNWNFFGQDLGRIILFLKYPGMSFQAAVATGLLTVVLMAYGFGLPTFLVLDIFSIAAAGLMSFGLLGCYADRCFVGWPVSAPLVLFGVSLLVSLFFARLNRAILGDADFGKWQRRYGLFFLGYLIFYSTSFLMATRVWGKSWNWLYLGLAIFGIIVFLVRYWGIWQSMKFPNNVLTQIKNYLEKRHKDLEKKMKDLDSQDPVHTDDRNDTASDDMQAQNKAGHERVLALKHQLQIALILTRKALTKIKIGNYGTCENCGKMIDTDRLSIVPTATLCMSCEKKKEK